jgi:hypothetical protein
MHLPIAPNEAAFSDVGYRAMEKRNRSFDMTAGYRNAEMNLTRGERASARTLAHVTEFLRRSRNAGATRAIVQAWESPRKSLVIVLSDALCRKILAATPASRHKRARR